MPIFILFFFLGTLFGSFSTVLIDRWHARKGGILFGRSECPVCKTQLGWRELFPLFSYLLQNGKCKTCKTKIPLFYPLAEILMGLLFASLTWSHISSGGTLLSLPHSLLLLSGFVTGVYILYDFRYTEIPDQIMVPAIMLFLVLLIWIYFEGNSHLIFFDGGTYVTGGKSYAIDHLMGALILYTFFYLQILIPGGIYFIRKNEWKNFFELTLSYFLFPISLLIPGRKKSTQNEDEISFPTWIGGGDLRIALIIGLSLGTIHGIASISIAYILGSIIGILYLGSLRIQKKNEILHMIPFGPFLGIGWWLSILFHAEILFILENYFSHI